MSPETPECSGTAIRKAADRGYAMVELDIQRSRDGQPIVFHDRTLDEACGRPGAISDWPAEELSSIRYHDSQECILTLDQALAICASLRLGVMLDLKTGSRDPAFLEAIEALISKHGLENATVSITGTLEAREAWESVLFTPSSRQLDAVRQGAEPDLRQTFWFGLPPRLPSADVARLQACGAYVFPAINTFRYSPEDHLERAREDIERLQSAGVDGFQIDSVYDAFVRPFNNL